MPMTIYYIRAKVLFYPYDRGGRVCLPVGDGYAPYVRIEGASHDLAVRLNGLPLEGIYDVQYDVEMELMYHPQVDYGVMSIGKTFTLVEGIKAIGEGFMVSAILQKER